MKKLVTEVRALFVLTTNRKVIKERKCKRPTRGGFGSAKVKIWKNYYDFH